MTCTRAEEEENAIFRNKGKIDVNAEDILFLYDQLCTTHATSKLHFICDLHQQLNHVNLTEVHKEYERFRNVFETRNRSNIGVVFVRQLEQPFTVASVYDEERYACFFENECARLDSEVIGGYVQNAKMFLKVYTWKVYERWFGNDMGCHSPYILAVIAIDGLVNDARKIPYVKLHSGDNRLKFTLGNIEAEATNAIVQGLPVQVLFRDLFTDLGIALKEFRDLKGEPRDHSVPRWARHLGLLCLILIILALTIEWYIVRRKLAVKKSASGIKIVSGKSKTHLMF